MSGSAVLTCTASGEWNSGAPSCQPVRCPVLAQPQNGIILSANESYRGLAVARCIHGHIRKSGNFKRYCRANKTWSGDSLHCEGMV